MIKNPLLVIPPDLHVLPALWNDKVNIPLGGILFFISPGFVEKKNIMEILKKIKKKLIA